MSLDIWPPVHSDELQALEADSHARELAFITAETLDLLRDVRHGLDHCYALLAPVDPGSTLVVSTHRNEKVKGTITRVGTRIVKGTLYLQLKTLPPVTLAISQSNPIPITPLSTIHTHLTQCTDLAALILSTPESATPESLSAQLRILSHALADSIAILAGHHPHTSPPPPSRAGSSQPPVHSHTAHDPAVAMPLPPALTSDWTTASCSPSHFAPRLPPTLSFHLSLYESYIVLFLRALEPADAPVNLGTKLGLAIGTVRRLEHDEMDRVFRYYPEGLLAGEAVASLVPKTIRKSDVSHDGDGSSGVAEVYVREKIVMESADPCLMSLSSKLTSLSHTIAQARQNLAAVTGEEGNM